MDRRAAGALLALAACLASAAAAPTAGNQTALDLYDGASEGCYYNFQHYGEGDRIMTNEPCLNCTCHNRMLMCYLRVCPFTKPIGQDCSVEKRADQCCPIVTCPDVPVDLLTSTSTSPAEYGDTGVGKLDRYGCSINGKYFSEGSKVPSTPNKPCEHCYCIRNMTTCVMQECTLHVDGCTPIYHKDVCCPVRYSCDHPEDEIPLLDDMTTTVRPTPGFLLTTTTLAPVTQMTQDCVHDDNIFADGALIKTEKACQHCYCMKGDIVCVVQECGTPMENEGKNCTSMPPREGQCCPDTYICESDELTTETKTDFTTISSSEQVTTLTPPRRVSIEGSGYRNEPDEPFTEVPIFEPDTEGSGEEPFKPIDAGEMLIPEKETPSPFVTTEYDENIDMLSPSTTKVPLTDVEITEKASTEPDKGENTVPSGGIDEHNTEASIRDNTPEDDKHVPTTESYFEEKTTAVHEQYSPIQDTITSEADELATKPTLIAETTIPDYQSSSLIDKIATADDKPDEITEPTPSKQEDEKTVSEITTLKETDELTTKASDLIDSVIITTESTTAFVEQAAKTTTVQLPEEENEVLIKEPTTESSLQPSKPSVVMTETEPPLTKQTEAVTELPTSSKDRFDTTPINPVDNEIGEEPFPTSSPGRIPGEGDCLLDGVTYSNESIVPSSNNCHSSCRCISSIVKCDPIICSAPPDYMDNCQPMYDPPESCCPTYVCDHTKETVPPQSHSQMSGTESPAPTPTIQCNGDQCVVIKDKDESTKPTKPCTSEDCVDDSSKKTDTCGTEECQGTDEKTDLPSGSTEECIGDKCVSLQEHCEGGNCEIPITKDQSCDSESGCKIPVEHPCQGEDCKIQPEISPAKDGTTPCNSADGCKDSKVPERTSDCEGESCLPGLPSPVIPDDTEQCKDGSDCYKPPQTESATDECNEESCIQKPVSDISKPATGGCSDSNCVSQENIPQITDAPLVTEVPVSHETKSEETGVTKTDKEEPGKTTQPMTEEFESTTQYNKKDGVKIPELETQAPEEEQYDSQTEITIQKETTTTPLVEFIEQEDSEVTPIPTGEISTLEPKLSEDDRADQITELPDITETKLPEPGSEPIDQFDASLTTSHTDTINDVEKHDITTAPPTVHVSHDASTEAVTESQEKQTTASIYIDMDKQGVTTEIPQLEREQGETDTESTDTEVALEETKKPVPNVTERTEAKTTVQEQKDTDKSTEESVDQEEVPVTPQYDSETKSPLQSTYEEKLDSTTKSPETTLSPIVEEEKQETLLPVSVISPSDETTTKKPDDVIPASEYTLSPNTNDGSEELETNLPDDTDITSKPEILIGGSSSRAPELTTELPELVTDLHDMTTRVSEAPQEIEDQSVVTPSENTVSNKFEAETPMSFVKDQGEDEINRTQTPPTDIDDMDQEQSTKKPEPSTPHSTESYSSQTEETSSVRPETEEIDVENMPSLSDEEHMDVATKIPDFKIETTSPVLRDATSTEKPIKELEETEAPASRPSTEATPVSVSMVEESSILGHDESSVTEATIHKTSAPYEDVSEIVPESFTEISTQTVSEAVDIVTPTRDESGEKEDDATEIPELTIHEHTDSVFTTMESEVTLTEKVTEAPDSTIVPQKDIIDKEVTKTPELLDTSTSIPKIPVKEMQEEESVTNAPGIQQTEINELKPQATTDISEISPTESQKIPAEVPESQDASTYIPEISVTEKEKEPTEVPIFDFTTSDPKISVTEPVKEETLIPELHDINVPDTTETETVKDVTEGPELQDISTKASEVSAKEPNGESTEAPETHDTATHGPEIFEVEPHKEASEAQGTTDANISDVTAVELDEDITKIPEMQDADTKIHEPAEVELQNETTVIPEYTTTKSPEILVTEKQKHLTDIPDIHETITVIPNEPSIESEEEASKTPEMQNVVTDVPEISATEPQKETTEISVAQDVATNVPEIPVTETEKEATEPQKEVTVTPVSQTVVTNISGTEPITESQESPVTQDAATNVPEMSLTDTDKEITEKPEPYDTVSNIPETPTTESQKETSESSEPQDVVNVIPHTGTGSPMDITAEPEQNTEPHKEITEAPETDSQKDVTESPEVQATSLPKISGTEPHKEVTEESEVQDSVTNVPEIAVTDSSVVTVIPESQNAATDTPDESATEQEKEGTKSSESPEIITNAPEISGTEPHEKATEAPVEEFVTKPAERTQTESGEFEIKTEESTTITERDIITESPLKITTKSEEHTESEPSETDMQTESPKMESSLAQPTEGELSNERSTKVPESLVTETTESDFVTTKPTPGKVDGDESKQEDNIVTESSISVPTKTPEHIEPEKSDIITELPISHVSLEFDTKSPHLHVTELDVTISPKDHVTEKEEHVTDTPEATRRTEATSPSLEQEDNVTKSPEDIDQTSETKLELPETTPYLVILEEHTHKKDINTMSPDDEITTVSSGLPSDYEPSTPGESIPITETEKPSQEEAMPSDKDQSIPESETTIAEKITEHYLASGETTTIASSPALDHSEQAQVTEKPTEVESNEISTSSSTPAEEQSETEKPFVSGSTSEADQDVPPVTEKQPETTAPEEEFILATTKATTLKTEDVTTPSPIIDKFDKPDESPKPVVEDEKPKPDTIEEIPKPVTNDVQTTEEIPQPDDESHFPPSGTSSYGQEPDYGEEDQAFGPGTCRYGGKVYVSAQQIPRDDPCDFCFCFRSDIICLQQSCPPPIHGCHEEPIQGFCCPRYECPVSMATSVNVTTTTTTTTTTLPPHFLPHAYPGMVQRRGCQIKGHTYKVGEVVRASSGPCLHCTCGGDGQMKCDPKVCTPEPMLRQMIAAAVSAKRRR